jgi:hypothetical protein
MPPRAAGRYEVRKQRARKVVRAEAIRYVIPYVGPYAALERQMPDIGSTVAGYPADYKVAEVSLEEGRADDGRMTVYLEKLQPGNPGSQEQAQIGETVYELDWGEERRPIEEHAKCGSLNPNRAADPNTERKRTWDDWQSLESSDYEPRTGGWTLAQYQGLKEKGYNDYPVCFPIARVTRYARFRIAPTGNVWKPGNPPSQCNPPNGYYYVKTAARSQRSGRIYQLVEEWRGYDRADDLFFL